MSLKKAECANATASKIRENCEGNTPGNHSENKR